MGWGFPIANLERKKMSELTNMLANLDNMMGEKRELDRAIRRAREEMVYHVLRNEKAIAEYIITHASTKTVMTAAHRTGKL